MRFDLVGVFVAVCSILCACVRPTPSATPLGEGPSSRIHVKSEREPGASTEGAPAKRLGASTATEDHSDPTDSRGSGSEASKPPEKKDAEAEAKKDKPATTQKADATAWDGEYAGEDVATYRFEGAPDRIQRDPKASTRVQRENEKIRLTIVDSSNGKDLCVLTAKLEGAKATLETGQECFSAEQDKVRTRGVVTTGTASLEGDRLVIEAELDFELRAADRVQKGRLSYRFEGKRK